MQDADDYSHPDRLKKQIAYLRKNPKIGVVGTNRQTLTPAGKIKNHKPMPAEIDIGHLEEGNRVISASAMMRTDKARQAGGYDEWFATAEDYDLWMRMVGITRIDNLPEPLYVIREHLQSTTAADPRAGELYRMAALAKRFGKLTDKMRAEVKQNGILAYEKYLSPKETGAYIKFLAAAYKKQGMYGSALKQYQRLAEIQRQNYGKVRWKVRRSIWLMKLKDRRMPAHLPGGIAPSTPN